MSYMWCFICYHAQIHKSTPLLSIFSLKPQVFDITNYLVTNQVIVQSSTSGSLSWCE